MTVSNIVHIRPFEFRDEAAFRELNLAWITQYFEVEQTDLDQLEQPQAAIIEPGGAIVVAEYDDVVVGCCALIKKGAGHYELAKMAVAEHAQGRGVGYKLGQAILEAARARGAESVFLESNTILNPALELYKKLGFAECTNDLSPYARCNVQMVVELHD